MPCLPRLEQGKTSRRQVHDQTTGRIVWPPMNLARPNAATKSGVSLEERIKVRCFYRRYAQRFRSFGFSGVAAQECIPVWAARVSVGQSGAVDRVGRSRQSDRRAGERSSPALCTASQPTRVVPTLTGNHQPRQIPNQRPPE
jgi:hypothetical protein